MDGLPDIAGWIASDPRIGLALLFVVGIGAGIINSMAGGGAFISLPTLMALGVPPSVANGTIRVAVLAQNITATATFHRRGEQHYKLSLKLAAPALVGALGGSVLATQIPDDNLKPIFGALLLVWGGVLLFNPKRFLEPPEEPKAPDKLAYGLAFVIGIYGGFLQAGVGFPLIALLSGYLGLHLVKANSVKVIIVGAYTAMALPVFAYAGKVAWTEALVLAAATSVGAWLGTRWQLKSGAGVVRWFVIVAVVIAGAMMVLG